MIRTRQIASSTILIVVLFLVSFAKVSAKENETEVSKEMFAHRDSEFNRRESSSEQIRGPRAVNESKFNYFYSNVKSMSFSKDKLKMIQTGALGNKFDCNQVAKLLTVFSFAKEKMEALELLAGTIVDKENYRKIEECFTFQSEKEQVRDILLSTSSHSYSSGRVMGEDSFDLFYDNVKSVSSSKDKLKMVHAGGMDSKMTCQQTAKLIKIFSFAKEKIEALELLAGAIVDRENYKKIEECFTFQSEKEQVHDILLSTKSQSHSSENRGGKAMNEDDFNLFHDKVKKVSYNSERLKMLRTGATSNKFTCNQAVILIKDFSLSSDRLEVINILGGKIIDRENYRKIEECFILESDRKKVRAALGIE